MKKLCFLLFLGLLGLHGLTQDWEGPSTDFENGKLILSENNRFLCFENGTPFLYLGNTGWELFHRLTLDESERYLENRRKKDFLHLSLYSPAMFNILKSG